MAIKRERVYVVCDGALYSFSPRAWQAFLTDVVADLGPDPGDFGTLISKKVIRVTDMSGEEAKQLLFIIKADRNAAKKRTQQP